MKSKTVQEFKDTEIGKIPSDWKIKKLEELIFIKGRIGWKGLKKSEFTNEGIIIINGPQIKNGKVNWNQCLRVPYWRHDESQEISVKEGDILMTKDGTIGKMAYIENLPESANLASGIFLIRSNSEKLDQRFLYYYFNSKFFNRLIESRIEGSVIPHLYQRDIIQLSIPLPSISEQQSIAKIVFDINSKIENLQNQNNILKQIVQAIFKSWFIDFDGVTEFEDSKLGKIPKGWNVEKISDVCKTFGGGTPSTKNPDYWNGSNYWLVPSDLTSLNRIFCVDSKRKITDEGLQNCASQIHPEKSIFMTSRATIGVFCINEIPAATNQGFIVSRPNNPNYLYYIFLNYLNRVDEFLQNANGSVFLEISRSDFRQLPILMPTPKILDNFNKEIKPFFDMLFDNEQMIELLTKTRDVLLPKLMSGEIRV